MACPPSESVDDREAIARARHWAEIRARWKRAGGKGRIGSVFLRAFKKEKELEVWFGASPTSQHFLFRTYPVLAASGGIGPKLKEGDKQVPEGWYRIDRFNPKSRFHLSMGLNYPNAADRTRADAQRPGGDIFIHGSNVSIGCLAIGNENIEELYTLCRSVKGPISALLLPGRHRPRGESDWQPLWRSLFAISAQFDAQQRPPRVAISDRGEYVLAK